MSTSNDIQTILYPFLYNAPSELTIYTPKAIKESTEYIKIHRKFNKNDYKSCESLEETQEEIFGIWWQIWGNDRVCYPVDGNISNAIEDLVPGSAYWEMIESSRKRFTDIFEQIIFATYSKSETMTSEEVRTFITQRWESYETDAEKENTEAYEGV